MAYVVVHQLIDHEHQSRQFSEHAIPEFRAYGWEMASFRVEEETGAPGSAR